MHPNHQIVPVTSQSSALLLLRWIHAHHPLINHSTGSRASRDPKIGNDWLLTDADLSIYYSWLQLALHPLAKHMDHAMIADRPPDHVSDILADGTITRIHSA